MGGLKIQNSKMKHTNNSKPFSFSFRAVIYDNDGRMLILKRSSKCKEEPGKWEFSGGKLHRNETFDNALHREVTEETGLKVDFTRPLGIAEFELDSVKVICLMMEGNRIDGQVKLSEEHDEFKWIDSDDLIGMDFVVWFRKFIDSHLRNS